MKSNRMLYLAFWVTCLWPLGNFFATNFSEFQRSSFVPLLQPLFIIVTYGVVGTLFFYLIGRIWPKIEQRLIVVACVGTILFFTFSIFLAFVGDVLALFNIVSGGTILTLGLIAVTLVGVFVVAQFTVIVRGLSVGIVAMGLLSVIPLAPRFFDEAGSKVEPSASVASVFSQRDKTPAAATGARPNIYYIIADGFVGPRNFERMTGESLSFLAEPLAEKGFAFIKNARSNYLGSASSIGSLFHLDYFRDENSTRSTLPENSYFPAVIYRRKIAPTLAALKALGYKLAMSGSWYSACQESHVECIQDGAFYLNRETLKLLSSTPFANVLGYLDLQKIDAITPVTEHWLPSARNNQAPTFVFVHHMQPHNPWFFDAQCRRVNTVGYTDRELYEMSVRCLAKTFRRFVEEVDRSEPGSIVVMHGDHGWYLAEDGLAVIPEYEWTARQLDMRVEISNFIRAPERCKRWLRDDLGPVNTMRFVLACAANEKPAYLDERLYVPGENYDQDQRVVRRENLFQKH